MSKSSSHQKLRDPSSTFTLSTGVLGFSISSIEKKRMLIKSADDPKIEGVEISRKAGP